VHFQPQYNTCCSSCVAKELINLSVKLENRVDMNLVIIPSHQRTPFFDNDVMVWQGLVDVREILGGVQHGVMK